MSFAVPVERGCGSRVAGGVYIETAHGPGGQPVEFFLLDPPLPIPKGMNLSAIGVHLVEVNGVYHILDVIGREHYPNVADYIEEVRHFGLSRRLPSNLDYSKLTPSSRIICAHERAIVTNMGDWFDYAGNEDPRCPKLKEGHPRSVECCAWVWWNDIEWHEPPSIFGTAPDTKSDPIMPVMRVMPSFNYRGHTRPKGVTPKYQQGFFGRFPIGRIVVVRGNGHEKKLDRIRKSTSVRVDEVDQ